MNEDTKREVLAIIKKTQKLKRFNILMQHQLVIYIKYHLPYLLMAT